MTSHENWTWMQQQMHYPSVERYTHVPNYGSGKTARKRENRSRRSRGEKPQHSTSRLKWAKERK